VSNKTSVCQPLSRRRGEDEIEHGIRSNVTRVAECIRHLDAQDPGLYVSEFHPHTSRYLAEGMRPDPVRVARAIDFLSALHKEISAKCPTCGSSSGGGTR